jgi:hypothetical protein
LSDLSDAILGLVPYEDDVADDLDAVDVSRFVGTYRRSRSSIVITAQGAATRGLHLHAELLEGSYLRGAGPGGAVEMIDAELRPMAKNRFLLTKVNRSSPESSLKFGEVTFARATQGLV